MSLGSKRTRSTSSDDEAPPPRQPRAVPDYRRLEPICIGVALVYFALKAFYFCFRIRPGLFPDETTHLGIAKLFSQSFFPPADSVESFHLGLITHVPNLYYILMGKLLAINGFGVSELLLLRVANALLAILGVLLAWRLIRLLSPDSFVRVVFIILLTNTLMFTFISAGVSYDNLVNLLSVASLYYLCRYIQRNRVDDLLLFLIFTSAGTLTKTTFLPYAFALLMMLFLARWRSLGAAAGKVATHFATPSVKKVASAAVLVLLVVLNVKLYPVNWVRFGHLVPETAQVLRMDQAMKNRIFARNRIVRLYNEGEIMLEQAQAMASGIAHPGDRADTLYSLSVAASNKRSPRPRADRLIYAFPWTASMLQRTYGVAAHKVMQKAGYGLSIYIAIYLLFAGALIRRFRRDDLQGFAGYLILVSAFYALVIMQLVNYEAYKATGVMGIGLQGRYLFPILAPFYALVSFYLVGSFHKPWKWVAGAVLSIAYILGELPWFLQRVSDDWLR